MPEATDTQKGERISKRSVSIAGHRTSVSLEEAFWAGLKEIAEARDMPIARLIASIDSGRTTNLSSAIRVFVLHHFTARDPEPGP